MELTKNYPSMERLLDTVGLQTRQEPAIDMVSALAIFATGLLVGTGLGLLFAPEPGQRLRSEIRDRLVDFRNQKGSARDEKSVATGSARSA